MTELISNPVVQSAAIPFFLTLILAGVMAGTGIGQGRYSGLVLVAGFLAAHLVIFGFPPLPPKSSGQKILYIVILGAAAGLYLERVKAGPIRALAVGLLICLITLLWIGWRKISSEPSEVHLFLLLLFVVLALVLYFTEFGRHNGTDEGVPFLITFGTLAGIAILGASASTGQNSGAMAAAFGGILILNWPKRRFAPSATGRMMAFALLSALLSQMMLFTKAPVWVLAIMVPAFFGGQLFDLMVPHDNHNFRSKAAMLRPIFIGVLAVVLSAIVFGLTLSILPPSDPYAG